MRISRICESDNQGAKFIGFADRIFDLVMECQKYGPPAEQVFQYLRKASIEAREVIRAQGWKPVSYDEHKR